MKTELGFLKILDQVETIFLLVIAVLTVIGVVKEIYFITVKRDVGLQDLLLMFLYFEVLSMVGAYYESKQVPITLPIFIAITALARATLLEKQDPLNIFYQASAILILAIASIAVNYRPARGTLTTGDETRKSPAE